MGKKSRRKRAEQELRDGAFGESPRADGRVRFEAPIGPGTLGLPSRFPKNPGNLGDITDRVLRGENPTVVMTDLGYEVARMLRQPNGSLESMRLGDGHAYRKRAFTDEDWLSRWPEGSPAGTWLPLENGESVVLSYVGIANLVVQADSSDVECRLTGEGLRAVSPALMHQVACGYRVTGEKGTFVRLGLYLQTRDGGTMKVLHDTTTETWESLTSSGPARWSWSLADMVQASYWDDPIEGMQRLPADARITDEHRPTWAGARAFDKVWEGLMLYAKVGHDCVDLGTEPAAPPFDKSLSWSIKSTIGLSMSGLHAMCRATEVLIDPDQVNAMPDFESWEEIERYTAELHLPFDDVFLDMEGPARSCAQVKVGDEGRHVLVVRGAHLSRSTSGGLMVMPFGGLATTGEMDEAWTYDPLGLVAFNASDDHEAIQAFTSVLGEGYIHTSYVVDCGAIVSPLSDPDARREGEQWEYRLGYDEGERTHSLAYTNHDMGPDSTTDGDSKSLAFSAANLVAAARLALRALFLLEAGNVEIVDAPVSRQVRRAAERAGEKIALSVLVHTSSKRYVRTSDEEERVRREYSHRFRVRGHMSHYGIGTRMADSRPDLVRPCGRCGRCRKIWVPPYVKGPEDRPLILKSLVVRDDD